MGTVTLPATDSVGNAAMAAPRAPFSTRRTPAMPSVSARSPLVETDPSAEESLHDRGPAGLATVFLGAEQGGDLLAVQPVGAGAQVARVGDVEPRHPHADAFHAIDHGGESLEIHDRHMLAPTLRTCWTPRRGPSRRPGRRRPPPSPHPDPAP